MKKQVKSMKTVIRKITSIIIAVAMCTSSFAGVVYATGDGAIQGTAIQKEIYVSINGSDQDGNGTVQSPYATVDKAKQEVAKINSDMTGNIIVNISKGDYYLDNTITFGEKDSGTNGYEVIYRSCDGIGAANLIGGDKITGFVPTTEADVNFDLDPSLVGKVYKVQLDKDKYDFNTMYVNDSRAVMARTRNRDNNPGFPMAKGEYMRSTGGNNANRDMYFNLTDVDSKSLQGMINAQARGEKEIGQVFVWDGADWDWFTDTLPIESISGNHIKFPNAPADYPDKYTTKYNIGSGARFYLQGNLAFMDVEGEYHYNKATGVLYYYPKAQDGLIENQTVVVPTMQKVLYFKGADKVNLADVPDPLKQVHNITIDGLGIKDTEFADYYCPQYEASSWERVPEDSKATTNPTYCTTAERPEFIVGSVTLRDTNNITITNTRVKNSGMYAVVYAGDNQYNTLENSVLENCGNGGLMFDGGYPAVGKYNNHNMVNNLLIHDVGEQVGHAIGFSVMSSGQNNFTNMEIYNTPKRAILIIGGWAYYDGIDKNYDPINDMYTVGNHFKYIYVHDAQQDAGEDSAIFMSWLLAGKDIQRLHGSNDPNNLTTNLEGVDLNIDRYNYLDQIIIADVGADPSVIEKCTVGGLDTAMGATGTNLTNVKGVNTQHHTLAIRPGSYGDIYFDKNCNTNLYTDDPLKTFDESKMEYDKIGLTATFPLEYRVAKRTYPQPPNDIYFGDDFESSRELDTTKWAVEKGNLQMHLGYAYMAEDPLTGGRSLPINADLNKSGMVVSRKFANKLNKVVEVKYLDRRKDYANADRTDAVATEILPNSFLRVDNGITPLGIGAVGKVSKDYYQIKKGDKLIQTNVKRSFGWHTFKFDYTSETDVKLYIDDTLVGTFDDVATSFNYIGMGDWDGIGGKAFFDQLYVYGGKDAPPVEDLVDAGNDTVIYVPQKIEAEYGKGADLNVADCNDGGKMLSDIKLGQEITYTMYAPKDQNYKLAFRVASSVANDGVEVWLNGSKVNDMSFTSTGSLTSWATQVLSNDVNIKKGENVLKLVAKSNKFRLNYMNLNSIPSVSQKIEAETGVFTGISQPKPEQGDGGTVLGFAQPGQIYTYTVNAPKAGAYKMTYRAATGYSNMFVECWVNGAKQQITTLPDSKNNWDKFYDIDGGTLTLDADENEIQLKLGGPNLWVWNFNWFSLGETSSSAPADKKALETAIITAEDVFMSVPGMTKEHKIFNAVILAAKDGYYDSTLTEEVAQSLIDNLTQSMQDFTKAVEESSKMTATEVANSLTITNPVPLEEKITLPAVPLGYKLEVVSSSDENIIDKKGNISWPDSDIDVTMTFKVTKILDSSKAQKAIIVSVAKYAADDALNSITIESPAFKAKKLTMPQKSGFKFEIISSTDNIVAPDGVITAIPADKEVTLTVKATKLSNNNTATKDFNITVLGTVVSATSKRFLGKDCDAYEIGNKIDESGVPIGNSGQWLRFDDVDFGDNKVYEVTSSVAIHPEFQGKYIELHLDSATGEKIGEFKVMANPIGGDWGVFYEHKITLEKPISGIHNIAFVGRGGEGIGHFGWVEFKDVTPIPPTDPADKADLEALVSYAKAQRELDEYKFVVPVVKSALDARIASAEAIIADVNATQANVDLAYDKLLEIVHMLHYTGDSTTLKATYDTWYGFNQDEYTADSALVLTNALEAAKLVLDNENSLQKEIDTAMEALDTAIKGLKDRADITALLAQIETAKKYSENLDSYLPVGKDEFISALENANLVAGDTNKTNEEIEAARIRLRNAGWALREIPNKDKLQELLTQANALDVTGYTASSVKARAEAISYAQTVMADKMATQEDVNAAITGIKTTTANLVLVEDEKTDDKEVTDKETTDKTEDTTVPTTSDTTPLAVVFAFAMVSCACVMVRKKVTR